MQWSKPTARESSFLLLWLWLLPPRNPVYTQWEDSSQERTSVVLDAGRVSGRLGPNIAGTTAPPNPWFRGDQVFEEHVLYGVLCTEQVSGEGSHEKKLFNT